MEEKVINSLSRRRNQWSGISLELLLRHPGLLHATKPDDLPALIERLAHPDNTGLLFIYLDQLDQPPQPGQGTLTAGQPRLVIDAGGSGSKDLLFMDLGLLRDHVNQGNQGNQGNLLWQELRQRPLVVPDALELVPGLAEPDGQWPCRVLCLKTMARLLENGRGEGQRFDLPSLMGRYLPDGDSTNAEAIRPLYQVLVRQLITAGLAKVWDLETSVLPIVHRMQRAGIGVDRGRLQQVRDDYAAQAEAKAEQVKSLLGSPSLNLDSSEEVLKAFKGAGVQLAATAAEDLCMFDHPACAALAEYRSLKSVSGSAETYLKHTGPDGRIYPQWDPLGADTGRFTCSEPPFQNLNRNADLRACFVPRPGCVFIAADYAQADVRVLAHVAKDQKLLAIFASKGDFHRSNAAALLNKPMAEVTPEERQVSKAIVFGIIYGAGFDTLCVQARLRFGLNWTQGEAKKHLQTFDELYPELAKYRKEVREEACSATEALTPALGRRKLLTAEGDAYNRGTKVLNMTAQGTIADAVKLAMVKLASSLQGRGEIVANIHDAVLLEVPDKNAQEVSTMAQSAMSQALEGLIPGTPVQTDVKTLRTLSSK